MSAGERSSGESERILARLSDLARTAPNELAASLGRLGVRELAELALRLPPARRIELLLHAPKPLRLVRALPDQDFYLTVREVGPADSMPVLSLASASQLIHLFDLESWRGDRFDALRAGAWVALLLEAGEAPARRFLRAADDEVLVLLLVGWARVEQIEYEDSPEKHGHGEGDAGTELGTMTPDGYHRFAPAIQEHVPAVRRLLELFLAEQGERYQRLLWSALWELPSEVEEQALQWRQSRLEEHGFPSREDALSIYAPPAGAGEAATRLPDVDAEEGLEAPRSMLMVLPPEDALVRAVDALDGEPRERVLFELLSVANRVLVADAADPGDPTAHRAAMRKAAGHVVLALEARDASSPARAADVLGRVPVIELFREGHAPAVALQRRARALLGGAWTAGQRRALELLDPPIRERIEALLEPRPLYVEQPGAGRPGARREFRTLAELEETAAALEMSEVLAALWSQRLGLDTSAWLGREGRRPTFATLWNTMLAWHATRGELRTDALSEDVAADFLRTVASRRTAAPDAPERALAGLVADLVRTAGLRAREAAVLESFGRYGLERLAEECAGLDPGVPLGHKDVSCLLL